MMIFSPPSLSSPLLPPPFSLTVHSEEGLFLLATCYYRSGKAYKAYHLLKGHSCTTPQCKYLLAKCCVELSKYVTAIYSSLFQHGLVGTLIVFGDVGQILSSMCMCLFVCGGVQRVEVR